MYRVANDTVEARKLLDDALEQLGKTDSRYCEAELLCIDGELKLAMAQPDPNGAETLFRLAIELARRQSAKAVELRAAMCMAQLWVAQDKRSEARALLTPIYGWFTEGFATAPLARAKRMIDSLA
jgi:predicted ATPase